MSSAKQKLSAPWQLSASTDRTQSLASEILENLELNRKTHGLANASVTVSTLIGAALRFIVETFGADAAGREGARAAQKVRPIALGGWSF